MITDRTIAAVQAIARYRKTYEEVESALREKLPAYEEQRKDVNHPRYFSRINSKNHLTLTLTVGTLHEGVRVGFLQHELSGAKCVDTRETLARIEDKLTEMTQGYLAYAIRELAECENRLREAGCGGAYFDAERKEGTCE